MEPLLDVTQLVKTKDEAKTLIVQLPDAAADLTSSPVEEALEKYVSFRQKDAILDLMKRQGIPSSDKVSAGIFFTKLEKTIAQLPVVTITLAFAPKKQLVDMIFSWFLVHTKRHVLLDLQVDPSILAGVRIEFCGVYRDYSIKKTIDDLFAKGGFSTLS